MIHALILALAVFDGRGLASGMYFYRLETQGAVATGKMVMMK